MTAPASDSPTARHEREAWRWLLRRRHAPHRDTRAFARWLAADPRHLDAYARAEALWSISETPARWLADEEAGALQGYLQTLRRKARLPLLGHWPGALASACCLLLVLWGGGWLRPVQAWQNLRADEVSAAGEVRELNLADGSRVLLDADSALKVRVDGPLRRVELLRGGAWFKVAHDGRPFQVDTGDSVTRVLGTAFEVRRQASGTAVTVEEGRVEVAAAGETRVLGANQRVRLADGHFGEPQAVDSRAALAWRDGRLSFLHAPLGEVLEALGSHYRGRILLLDPALAERPVSVSVAGDDAPSAVASLCAVLGCQSTLLFDRLILIR
ncbi:FecR family protein [Pseudomonas sp. UBA6310]|uniref:FecR family protein n=1 Tax=Pseudomonas sp. UBA6310 TaxID=1947327 RepID=UPI00257D709F|nr:FecR domain-containing protein [Pseudomonas sp. UBA6310]